MPGLFPSGRRLPTPFHSNSFRSLRRPSGTPSGRRCGRQLPPDEELEPELRRSSRGFHRRELLVASLTWMDVVEVKRLFMKNRRLANRGAEIRSPARSRGVRGLYDRHVVHSQQGGRRWHQASQQPTLHGTMVVRCHVDYPSPCRVVKERGHGGSRPWCILLSFDGPRSTC